MIIPEDFKENYANEPQKNNGLVSEKFIRFIAERGIPINNAVSGEPLIIEQQPALIDYVNTATTPWIRSLAGTPATNMIPVRATNSVFATSELHLAEKTRP
jgi:hypothetical protein